MASGEAAPAEAPPRVPSPAPAAAAAAAAVVAPAAPSKYSSRVVLRTVLERSDGGLGLVGEKLVVGGWVKSSREEKKEAPAAPAPAPPVQDKVFGAEHKDVSCVELFQTRIPIFRSIMKIFGGGGHPTRQRIEAAGAKPMPVPSPLPPPPPPSVAFLQISDGSCVATLLVEVDSSLASPSLLLPTGTCLLVEGTLKKPETQGKHTVELKAENILHIGMVDQDSYILSKKRLPLDALRNSLQFRPRTTTVASVMRIRNALTFATHLFFHDNGFLNVQVPIITSTDDEGSSQKFHLVVLPGLTDSKRDQTVVKGSDGVSVEAIKAAAREKSKLVEELKRTDSNREALVAALQDLKKTDGLASQLEAQEKLKRGTPMNAEEMKFFEDFFPNKTYLTASGRLHLESYACALGQVYSFGPRFQADRSESHKEAAEMWMVEVEIAFSELEDVMKCAENFLKFSCKWIMDNCAEDFQFVAKRIDKACIDRLQSILSKPSVKITYREAVGALKKATDNKEMKIEEGGALTAAHLSYLADEIHKSPVIVYNYPKEVKPFYVRQNDDGETVAAFDMVLPKVGRLLTGSQSEERIDLLSKRMKDRGVPQEQYEWYMDLRRHGTVKHSGFSVGFDLMVLFATGLTDVRDVIPFPRSFGKADC
ncbi:hypothetical protein ACJRO7_030115 [Eucalyptus globulus]|uniref:Aminoacyl-tRNA synthetase class II (D/K/N) domain-containing protein n=1 Tax=Eucalyptus globulus TaxID=34317 RepID=A0ABD3JLH0_EUCGL